MNKKIKSQNMWNKILIKINWFNKEGLIIMPLKNNELIIIKMSNQ